MKLSQEQQQAMYPTDQQIQDHQQSMVSPPGIVINDKEQYNCKMSQEAEDPHAINSHRNGHMGENGHQFSHLKQSVMSHHHLHRMEFNGSGGDSHSSQSSGTSNEYIHGHHERQMDPHPRVADMAYPMMNLEEFIHQQTAGFSDPDSGSDRSGHSDYSRGSGHYEKSNYGDNKGGVIHHHGKPLIQLSADFSPSDLALATSPDSQYHFDPSNATFNSDELKPQPIISKSRKTLVPEGMKDNRYWARRAKNNVAAKRSREARRLKENQIILRASYLEKENQALKVTVERLTKENESLKRQQIYPN